MARFLSTGSQILMGALLVEQLFKSGARENPRRGCGKQARHATCGWRTLPQLRKGFGHVDMLKLTTITRLQQVATCRMYDVVRGAG